MMALLESDEVNRLERLLESVYFVERCMTLWSEGLRHTDKKNRWLELTSKERESLNFADFSPSSPAQVRVRVRVRVRFRVEDIKSELC
jgi:hypothetical protein